MMGRKAFVRFVCLAIFGGLVLSTARATLAAVVLDSFRAEAGDDQVGLAWVTGSELDVAGFFVHRNNSEDGNYSQWDRIEVVDAITGDATEFIPARGDSFGADYNFLDLNVQNGDIYCYALEAVDTDNSTEFFTPDNGTCHRPSTPTLTPTITQPPPPTDTPTPTLPPTITNTGPAPTNTLTPVATSTRTAAATSTARPSRTPSPTVTGTLPPTETPTITPTPTKTLTPTQTPFPTFLPTRTNTPTVVPTATPTLIPSATQGPLLSATLAAAAPSGGLFNLGGETALTLGELILTLAGLVALVGGLLFALLYFLILRNTNQ